MSDRSNGMDRGLRPLQVEADVRNLATIRDFIAEIATAAGFSGDAIGDLILAVDEAATNIIVHGYKDRTGQIEIVPTLRDDTFEVVVRDRCPPFDPTLVPPPDLSLPLEERGPGGLGIYLMRVSVDEVSYRITPEGINELTLKLKRR